MKVYQILVLICVCILLFSSGASTLSPFPITPKEQLALQQFRKIILPKIPASSLISNYSQDDLYLMKWLSSTYLNVKEAEGKFLHHLKWRKEESMDTINEEDWSNFRQEYPAFFDTFDKTGRPTAELWISEWDIRKAVLTGNAHKLTRWIYLAYELNLRRLMRLRSEGNNVTFAVIIVDSEGFTYRQLCPLCHQIFIRLGYVWTTHYPNLLESEIGVNLTPAFKSVLDGLKPLLPPGAKRVEGYSIKREWLPVLDSRYESSERSIRFGGTKLRNL